MTCAESHLLLHAYVDGELDVIRNLDFEKHAKACPECEARVKSLKALHAALAESEVAYHAPASLRDRLRQMAPAPVQKAGPAPVDLQWLWKWLAIGVTVAAILAIAVRPAEYPRANPDDEALNEVVACHVRSLMANHLTDILSSDQHTVKPWFEGKLDFAPDVRDFTANNFPLVGGRLDYVNARTVAALVYRHNKHLINVFIWPASGAPETGESFLSNNGYHIVSFNAEGFHYYVVSDMEESELKQLAGLLGG